MPMALGCPNHSVVAHHNRHSANTAHRCHEMRRAVLLNRSTHRTLYQREKHAHLPVATSVPDLTTNVVSAEGKEDMEFIEYESQNVENCISQSSSSYNLM